MSHLLYETYELKAQPTARGFRAVRRHPREAYGSVDGLVGTQSAMRAFQDIFSDGLELNFVSPWSFRLRRAFCVTTIPPLQLLVK